VCSWYKRVAPRFDVIESPADRTDADLYWLREFAVGYFSVKSGIGKAKHFAHIRAPKERTCRKHSLSSLCSCGRRGLLAGCVTRWTDRRAESIEFGAQSHNFMACRFAVLQYLAERTLARIYM
jgi:hypothetical protein